MDYIFNDFFDGYAQGIDVHDMSRIVEHFNYPCLIISGSHATACMNKDQIENVFRSKFRYIAVNFGQVTSYSVRSLVPFNDNNLIVSLLWNTQNKAGQTLSSFHCYYHLIKKDQVYKITVAILPEEKG